MSRVVATVNGSRMVGTFSTPVSPNAVTLFAWMDGNPNINNRHAYSLSNDPDSTHYHAVINRSGSKLRGQTNDGSSSNAANISMGTGWRPVAYVSRAANSRSLYVDSSTNVTNSTVTKSLNDMDVVKIGEGVGTSTSSWGGSFAHVAYWDIGLSTGDLDLLFAGANPLAIQSGNLIGYWSMVTDTGSTIPDESGNSGPTLTVSGSVSFSASNPTVDAPPSSVPDAPTLLVATGGAVSGRISLAWQDNADDEDNYTVERSANGSTGWSELTSTLGPGTEAYNDDTVANDVEWFYRVKATNSGGSSDYSNTDSATGKVTAPTPTSLGATGGDDEISLAWTNNHVAADGSSIGIERSANGSSGWSQIDTVAIGAEVYDDTGLGFSATWFYRIRVLNGSFPSAYSNTDSATTDAQPPPADPTLLVATGGVVSGRISLAWQDNATDEDNYTVERSANGSSGWSVLTSTLGPGVEAYNDDTVANDETWFYRVKATSTGGSSGYSNTDSATGKVTAPTPTSLVATGGVDKIDLAWTNNHVAADGSAIGIEAGGAGNWAQIDTVAIGETTYSDIDLGFDATETYRVRVLNDSFPSAYSNEDTGTSDPQPVPADPTLLVATSGVISGRISLAWQDNASNEANYVVERSPDGSTGWSVLTSTLPPGTESYDDDGLDNGDEWFYRVKATNGGGSSGYSNTDSAIGKVTAPTPTSLVATGGDGKIDLAWTNNHVADDGSAVAIERSANGSTGWSQIDTVAITAEVYSNTGLGFSETWFYRVRVLNDSFPSAYSNTDSDTSDAEPVPADPTGLAAVLDGADVDLTWNDIATNEVSYTVERSPNGSTGWVILDDTLAAGTEAFTDFGVPEDATWWYRVSAVNASGSSGFSETSIVIGLTVPAAPTLLVATAFGEDRIDLSWQDNATNEDNYAVWRSPNGVDGWIELTGVLPPDTEAYIDAGLNPGETWYYAIFAYNAAGSSAGSGQAHATTGATVTGTASFSFRMPGFTQTDWPLADRDFEMTGDFDAANVMRLVSGAWEEATVKRLKGGVWVSATVKRLESGVWE